MSLIITNVHRKNPHFTLIKRLLPAPEAFFFHNPDTQSKIAAGPGNLVLLQ